MYAKKLVGKKNINRTYHDEWGLSADEASLAEPLAVLPSLAHRSYRSAQPPLSPVHIKAEIFIMHPLRSSTQLSHPSLSRGSM
jgi:hypothetical protein